MTMPGASGIVRVPDSVFISGDALETIEANAFAEAPLECCGLLLGRFAPAEPPAAPPGALRLVKGEHAFDAADAAAAAAAIEAELGLSGGGGFSIPLPDVLTIEDAVPTRNASTQPTRYLVEPEDHFRILRDARRRGLDIVGAYHSHVITPPVPSETDRAEAHPHFLYVIASPDWDTGEGCETRAWWLVDGNFQEVTIVPVS
jgi:[CysO sulfur-carrier protein]-S-L-cysteine hydrolase